MKNFMRLVLSLVFIGLGCCNTVFLSAAQQPHKRKQEAEEPVAKKPRPEQHEEKTDADREEKEPERMVVDESKGLQEISVDDESNGEDDDDGEYEPSEQISNIEISFRDTLIRQYLKSPEYLSGAVSERDWFMSAIESLLAAQSASYSKQDCEHFYQVIDAQLSLNVYPMMAHFFDAYVLCDKDISDYATPGEVAQIYSGSVDFNGFKSLDSKKVVIQSFRGSGYFGRAPDFLQKLYALNPSPRAIGWLSDLSPFYKELFTDDQPNGAVVINGAKANVLVDQDIEVIRSVINNDQELLSLDEINRNYPAARRDFYDLVNGFGSLRYRLQKFIASLKIPGEASSVMNMYKNIIEKYASDSLQASIQVREKIDALRMRFGLVNVPDTHCSCLFDCWVISACCNELIRKMHGTRLEQILQDLVHNVVKFEIKYAGKVDPRLITHLNNKKKIILDEFSKIRIDTFRAYTKALLRLTERAQEIIVRSDEISDPTQILAHASDKNSICKRMITY